MSADNSKDLEENRQVEENSKASPATAVAASAESEKNSSGADVDDDAPSMSNDPVVNFFFECCRYNDSPNCLVAITDLLAGPDAKDKKLVQQQDMNSGRTALHMAAANGHVDVMRRLLDSGADPNAGSGSSGSTPLHDAVLARGTKAVPMLLAAGADPAVKNRAGETPLGLAEKLGFEELSSLLLKVDKSIETYETPSGKIVMEQVEDGPDVDEESTQVSGGAAAAAASPSSASSEPVNQKNKKPVNVDDVE